MIPGVLSSRTRDKTCHEQSKNRVGRTAIKEYLEEKMQEENKIREQNRKKSDNRTTRRRSENRIGRTITKEPLEKESGSECADKKVIKR